MSTEIATWNMIRSKIPTFPSPTDGRGNECLTKAEIQSLGGESLSIEGNYGNNECVILEHIAKVTWEYTFNVQPASLSFAAIGGAQPVAVTSYKRKYINDRDTGIQENVNWDYWGGSDWITINHLSSNGLSIITQENNTESQRNTKILWY